MKRVQQYDSKSGERERERERERGGQQRTSACKEGNNRERDRVEMRRERRERGERRAGPMDEINSSDELTWGMEKWDSILHQTDGHHFSPHPPPTHIQGWAHYTGTFLIVADPVLDRAIDFNYLFSMSQNMYDFSTKRIFEIRSPVFEKLIFL